MKRKWEEKKPYWYSQVHSMIQSKGTIVVYTLSPDMSEKVKGDIKDHYNYLDNVIIVPQKHTGVIRF